MATWSQMFPGHGDPLDGQSEDYLRAAEVAASLERSTGLINDEFDRVRRSNELGQLQGLAADQLTTLIKDVSEKLEHVPPFFQKLDQIFDHHARSLKELERKTADALARANSRWNEISAAENDEQSARNALNSIDDQIRQLDWSTDEPEIIEARRVEFQRIRSSRQWTLQNRINDTQAARRRLADIGEERRQFELTERALVQRTTEKLKNLDIGELADPNVVAEWIRDRAEDVADFATELVSDYINMYRALLSGDFMDALWYLSDYLEAIMTIVGVIALVAAVFFTGGTALAAVGLMLAATKFAVDCALFSTQHQHPETGRTISGWDLVIDGALLVVSALTLGAASKGHHLGDKLVGIGGEHKRSMVGNIRQSLKPVSHAGQSLHGAARTSTISRSAAEIGGTVIDEVIPEGLDRVGDEVRDGLTNPLTTDTDAWIDPSVVDFVDPTVRTLNSQVASIDALELSGPSLEPGSAQYQLVAA